MNEVRTDDSRFWQRFGDCVLVLCLIGYMVAYAGMINRVRVYGSLGSFACPSYHSDPSLDDLLYDVFYPIHAADVKIRGTYWSYRSYCSDCADGE